VLPGGLRDGPPVDEDLETAHQTHLEARHHTTLWRGTLEKHPNPSLVPDNHQRLQNGAETDDGLLHLR
jgi:hypothetical protein